MSNISPGRIYQVVSRFLLPYNPTKSYSERGLPYPVYENMCGKTVFPYAFRGCPVFLPCFPAHERREKRNRESSNIAPRSYDFPVITEHKRGTEPSRYRYGDCKTDEIQGG